MMEPVYGCETKVRKIDSCGHTDMDNVNEIDALLSEFKETRESIKKMIDDVEVVKSKIDSIFPQKLDNRYIHLFEEKVKATTEFLKLILEMRKEIAKSLKEEIEIRRKIEKDDSDAQGSIDIRELVDRIHALGE